MNVEIIGSVPSVVQGTIGANGTLSEEFDLTGWNSLGLLSDTASNGTMNFLVSWQPLSSGTNSYRLVRDNAGAAYALTIPSGSSAYKASDIAVLAPYRYVRLLSSVSQGAGNQFTFVVKG